MHPDFRVLTPHARLTLLVLRVAGQSNIAGIGWGYTEPLVAETGLAPRQIRAALLELEKKPTPEAPWIYRDGNLVWVRNALRFDPNLTLNNPNHVRAVQRSVAGLPRSSEIVQRFRDYYHLAEEREEAIGASHAASHEGTHHRGDGVSHGGIRSSRRTPSPNPNPTAIPNPSTEDEGNATEEFASVEEAKTKFRALLALKIRER